MAPRPVLRPNVTAAHVVFPGHTGPGLHAQPHSAGSESCRDIHGEPARLAGGCRRRRRPGGGRVCQTGIRLVGEITETLTAYDDTNRTLTYQATGMPAFVTLARNTWSVIAIDARTCRVSLRARFDTRGLLGRWVILAQTRRAGRRLAEDLRH